MIVFEVFFGEQIREVVVAKDFFDCLEKTKKHLEDISQGDMFGSITEIRKLRDISVL
jgi:hypothetical protein